MKVAESANLNAKFANNQEANHWEKNARCTFIVRFEFTEMREFYFIIPSQRNVK